MKKREFLVSFIICWWSISAVFLLFRFYTAAAIGLIHFVNGSTIFKSLLWGLGEDLLCGLVTTIILSPAIPLFKYRLKLLLVPFLLLLSFVMLGLEKYFISEMTPLGADIWAYSADDLALTLRASAGGGFSLFTGYLVIILAIIASVYFLIPLSRAFKRRYVWLSVMVFFVSQITLFLNPPESLQARYLSENHLAYFVSRSLAPTDRPVNTLAELAEYPFEKPFAGQDMLGPNLKRFASPPNIVFIQVEGLGSQFTGSGSQWQGFTPFLDSLSTHSLYWPNCLSTTGRTFGVVPALYGSLPLAKGGFMDLGPSYPAHFTLISWLAERGYSTSYFYGGNINFDKTDIFLEAQGVKNLFHEGNIAGGYEKLAANEEGFSWGYPDKALFDYYQKFSATRTGPRLDMLMTITTHEPFIVPEAKKYRTKFDQILKRKQQKEPFLTYREIFECLLYTDDAIKQLFLELKKRPDWQNTIIVITGDHRVIPLPQQSPLDRFHVPMIIYSPALKKSVTFKTIASHAQVAPSFLAYFHEEFGYPAPQNVPFLADVLPSSTEFGSELSLPLMQNKGELDMYIEGVHLLAGNELFAIQENMKAVPYANPELRKHLAGQLSLYKAKQQKALEENKLYSRAGGITSIQFTLSDSAMRWLETNNITTLSADDMLFAARDFAVAKNYRYAQWTASYLLNQSPNYADARILLGRTYAWEGDFDQSLIHLKEAQRRNPQYEESYLALADVYYWKDQPDSSMYWTRKGLAVFKNSEALKTRSQRLLK